MPTTERRRFEVRREPNRGLDVSDASAFRDAVLHMTSEQAALVGHLPGDLHWVGPEVAYQLGTDGAVELGEEAALAEVWVHLHGRPDVTRSFRRGIVSLEDDDGRRRRAVCVLELCDAASEGWWLAWRWFGRGDQGVGVFHGEWQNRHGTGADTLPDALEEWLDRSRSETKGFELGGERPIASNLDLRQALAPLEQPAPTTVKDTADMLGQLSDSSLAAQGMDHLRVYVVRPEPSPHGLVELWEIRGELRDPIDDLIRTVVQTGPAVAAALQHPCAIELDGVQRRGITMVVQHGGERLRRTLALLPGPTGLKARALYQRLPPAAEAEEWLETPPGTEIRLTVEGPVGGGVVAEG